MKDKEIDGVDMIYDKFLEICRHNPSSVDKNKVEIARECENGSLDKTNYVPLPAERLQSRLAYRSGFTELFEHFYGFSPESILELWDCASLYPYVAKIHDFLTGKFFVLKENAIKKRITIRDNKIYCDDKPFHGFIHARVIPPKDLQLPYLGMKTNLIKKSENVENVETEDEKHEKKFHTTKKFGKSKWRSEEHQVHVLCPVCCEKENPDPCNHKDYERSILSVMSSDEVNYMLTLNYEFPVDYIFEAWVFKAENRKRIFQKYMTFMEVEKIKHSKIPMEYEGNLDGYANEINKVLNLENEKFKLKKEDFEENPVKRSMIKSLCNCLFGRLGLKPRKTSSRILHDPKELEKFKDKWHKVIDVNMLNNKLELIMDEPMPFNHINRRTNVLIASQVNSFAKMFIHKHFTRLQNDERVKKIIAVNSDAFFIARKRDSSPLFEGLPEVFGHFRNEHEEEIKEFYGLNSRTYSLKMASGRTVSKALGFDLTYDKCNLNFETFRQLLLDKMIGRDTSIKVKQKRHRNTEIKVSDFSFSSNIAKKRKIDISETKIDSKPWGFV